MHWFRRRHTYSLSESRCSEQWHTGSSHAQKLCWGDGCHCHHGNAQLHSDTFFLLVCCQLKKNINLESALMPGWKIRNLCVWPAPTCLQSLFLLEILTPTFCIQIFSRICPVLCRSMWRLSQTEMFTLVHLGVLRFESETCPWSCTRCLPNSHYFGWSTERLWLFTI